MLPQVRLATPISLNGDTRIGIYNQEDPGPIPYDVIEEPEVSFSQTTLPPGSQAGRGFSMLFEEDLRFPFSFDLDLCNTSGKNSYR